MSFSLLLFITNEAHCFLPPIPPPYTLTLSLSLVDRCLAQHQRRPLLNVMHHHQPSYLLTSPHFIQHFTVECRHYDLPDENRQYAHHIHHFQWSSNVPFHQTNVVPIHVFACTYSQALITALRCVYPLNSLWIASNTSLVFIHIVCAANIPIDHLGIITFDTFLRCSPPLVLVVFFPPLNFDLSKTALHTPHLSFTCTSLPVSSFSIISWITLMPLS